MKGPIQNSLKVTQRLTSEEDQKAERQKCDNCNKDEDSSLNANNLNNINTLPTTFRNSKFIRNDLTVCNKVAN